MYGTLCDYVMLYLQSKQKLFYENYMYLLNIQTQCAYTKLDVKSYEYDNKIKMIQKYFKTLFVIKIASKIILKKGFVYVYLSINIKLLIIRQYGGNIYIFFSVSMIIILVMI